MGFGREMRLAFKGGVGGLAAALRLVRPHYVTTATCSLVAALIFSHPVLSDASDDLQMIEEVMVEFSTTMTCDEILEAFRGEDNSRKELDRRRKEDLIRSVFIVFVGGYTLGQKNGDHSSSDDPVNFLKKCEQSHNQEFSVLVETDE